jgi:hypothetical protein
MGGKQQPGPFGASAEEIDTGTLPRISTPSPSITSTAVPSQTLNGETVADAPLSASCGSPSPARTDSASS